jgi:ATP/maltotriose-dependent transcriptional regulator MalT
MYPRKNHMPDTIEPVTYSFGEHLEQSTEGQAMALLALSHTPVEHQLYQAMRRETVAVGTRIGAFNARRLMLLTGIKGYGTIRRALAGLSSKLSVERQKVAGAPHNAQQLETVYLIFSPEEIFARRRARDLAPYPQEYQGHADNKAFGLALERVVGLNNLSRREAQVAICCAEGLSNAEIGERLRVSEQTVKFHLRHIFVKFGVKRRAELVSRLLTPGAERGNGHHL